MSLLEADSNTRPAGVSDDKTVAGGMADATQVGPAVTTRVPAAGSPPPPEPPPPGALPPPVPPSGPNYSLPILIGVFIIALVGIGLLGLAIFAVLKPNPGTIVSVGTGPSTATLIPLATQDVLVPTTTPMPAPSGTPTESPAATEAAATATSAVTVTATVTVSATAAITPTASGNLVTVNQGANVRGGPGIIYPIVGSIKAGDTAPAVGRDVSSAWFVIQYSGGFGGQGWISSAVATYGGDKSQLPVVVAPPTPPPPVPTATPKPAGNPSGGLVTGPHGVSGMLNLCSSKVVFAVNERVCFVEWIKNNTTKPVAYGLLGVTAARQGGGVQFQTSWNGQDAAHGLLGIDPGCIGPTDRCKGQWEDGIRLSSAGSYQLNLSVCFSDYPTCRGTMGDWEVLSGAIVITVQ